MTKYKRILSVILILGVVFSLTACGAPANNADASTTQNTQTENNMPNQNGITVTDNRNNTQPADSNGQDPSQNAEIQVSDDDFSVQEYKYESKFGDTLWFLVVTNNSLANVTITSSAIARDSSGNAIGADDLTIDILGPGETTAEYFYFDDVSGVASVEYQLVYNTKPRWQPVISNLAVQQTLNNDNVTVTVTNNGSISAQFVQAYALFMDSANNVIRYDSKYIGDNDNEIKPGATIAGQLNCNDNYDHVLVSLTGRSDGTNRGSVLQINPDEFDIEEHLYESRYNTMYFITIKNNSENTVSVSGNATAKDTNGNSLGASNFDTIDVLAPGEESIGYFYFDITGINSIDYQLNYSDQTRYKPVISNLNAEVSINNNNVIVMAKNNGSYPAQFVQAYVLFFDANGKIVGQDHSYIIDDDNEIKVGATQTKQFNCREAFDHVGVFFAGRG